MKELIGKTREAQSLVGSKMGIEARVLDLVEEVGELANAVLVEEGHKGRKKADLADSLADVLYDLILVAEHYGIDLKKEYGNMLEELKKRAERGEFKD